MYDKVTAAKKLREMLSVGIYEAKKTLEDVDWDYEKAYNIIYNNIKIGKDKETTFGRVETYNHDGRIGVVIEVRCETDFMARTTEFISMCHNLAMQVAATDPSDVEKLLSSVYIRDDNKTINDYVGELSRKCRENIVIFKFHRIELKNGDGQPAILARPKTTGTQSLGMLPACTSIPATLAKT